MGITENDRLVHAYVRELARSGERATVDAASRATGVPRSSVAHVAKHMGYEGWADFTTSMVRYYSPKGRDDAIERSVSLVETVLRRNRDEAILVDAVGDAEICLMYVTLRLGELGLHAMPYGRGVADAMASPRGGALIVLNESGMALLPSCLHAVECGFEVVAITASHDTPISKLADVNVVIKNNKSAMDYYEPNYFTAGALAYLERVMAAYKRIEP